MLLAYSAAMVLAMIPITPGGLGFVEAGLTGLLALAGVSAGDAVLSVLAYRLVSFWLPLPAGGVAALLHRLGLQGPRRCIAEPGRDRGLVLPSHGLEPDRDCTTDRHSSASIA